MAELPPTRFGDDVSVGDELEAIEMVLDATAVVLGVSGSQDWNLPHHDPEFAVLSGMPGVFMNTGWTTGFLGRLLSEWAGDRGWVEHLGFQMRRMHMQGDTVKATGVVTTVDRRDDHWLVDVDIALENDRDGRATPGTARVRLPLRIESPPGTSS